MFDRNRTAPSPTYVHQGEYAVSQEPETILTAILGSCVATCLYDEKAGIGGINHILLPDQGARDAGPELYGVNLMELLINDLMRKGASRGSLKAKLFGGAKVISGLSNVGARNVEFARNFLKTESIPVIAESLGGEAGRRIRFWPTTGRARQILLSSADEVPREAPPKPPAAPKTEDDGIELF